MIEWKVIELEVILKFYGLGINNNHQASVFIYEGDNLIYEGLTYNGYITCFLKPYHIYNIKASFNGHRIYQTIYINKNEYIFYFPGSYINNIRTITFLVTDYYYNLPIEGELILWQR